LAVYQIVKEGNPVLREKAKPVKAVNEAAVRLLNNLRDTLRQTARGVGLAAPQIGISKRAMVIEIPEEDIYYEMINPRILHMEGQEEGWEGCLSVPGVEGLVARAEKLQVNYLNREGEERQLKAEGYLARVVQHENDHLDGILFTDKTIELHSNSEEKGE
jgi:peptide deformylase